MTPTYSPLLTDFYQLTMAYGYWRLNMHHQQASFELNFRSPPFKSNYTVNCGLASAIDFLQAWRFQTDDINYLATLKDSRHKPLFHDKFLQYLAELTFTCDVDAIPEGTVVFANEPLVRVQGPLIQCQLIETPLLNMINFQTLIATKAARICEAAQHDPVIEFGLRRAQGPDGGMSASRAAYIGGCVATSNTLAGKVYDIPLRGTHAHSWVTAFADEKTAFEAYASVMPSNCIFLVDTYNTLGGVKNAIAVGKKLRAEGADLLGIRLDSGDMASLSNQARQLLDEAGFEKTTILASNTLDEFVIQDLKQHGADISAWGVGTRLVTAYDQPALDGVYKLCALEKPSGTWEYKLKLSEQEVKTSNPGRHQIRRFFCNEQYVMDVIYDLDLSISDTPEMVLLDNPTKRTHLDDFDAYVDLLQPVLRKGKLVAELPSIHVTRQQARSAVKHFLQTHGDQTYPVGLEKNLFELKEKLIKALR